MPEPEPAPEPEPEVMGVVSAAEGLDRVRGGVASSASTETAPPSAAAPGNTPGDALGVAPLLPGAVHHKHTQPDNETHVRYST